MCRDSSLRKILLSKYCPKYPLQWISLLSVMEWMFSLTCSFLMYGFIIIWNECVLSGTFLLSSSSLACFQERCLHGGGFLIILVSDRIWVILVRPYGLIRCVCEKLGGIYMWTFLLQHRLCGFRMACRDDGPKRAAERTRLLMSLPALFSPPPAPLLAVGISVVTE